MVNTANGSEISTGIMYCLQYTSSWSSEPRKWHSGFRKIEQRIARMTLNPNATAISSEKISPASKHHPQSRCHINHRHRNINRRQSIRIYPTGNKNPVHGCIQVSNYFSPLFLFIFGAFFFTFSSRISANLVCTATATSNSASSSISIASSSYWSNGSISFFANSCHTLPVEMESVIRSLFFTSQKQYVFVPCGVIVWNRTVVKFYFLSICLNLFLRFFHPQH